MKKCLLMVFLAAACYCGKAQQAPKRELRGAWIATYANIDWPKNRTEPVVLKRAALISILDHHQATGINTIYFQIRSQCDAMYSSNIEPWSADLTGTQGTAPVETNPFDPTSAEVWDPLQFMIDECHRRGIELHAWINPYRAINNYNLINSFAANHVARQHPEWLLSQGNLRILDPGNPAAQEYIQRVIADVVSRYDLDGVHFDDYFYPPSAPAGVTPYNDDATFNADPRGFTNRGDWRRDNVSRFVKAVSETIKDLKPWVKFGVSPSGIYRNSTNPAIGSPTRGFEHYVTLFADTRKWLQEGWIDYLAPQVYWYIGQSVADYSLIVPWWNNNAYGRHIYIGMAGYKVNDPVQGVNWANPSMIPNEVRLNRSPAYPNVYGQSVYNTSSLLSTSKLGFRDSLRLNLYKYPALIPQMPWRDDIPPESPTQLTGIRHDAASVELNWTAPPDVANEFDKVKRLVIYRSESPLIDFTNPANIIAMTPSSVTTYTDNQVPGDATYYYAVTSIDRFSNESLPSNVTDYLPPVITCVPNQTPDVDLSCKLTLPDYTALASVSDDVSTSSAISVAQSPEAGTIIDGPALTVVTLTATDASGKSSACIFTVIGTDRLAPEITSAPDDILVSTGEESADCSVVVRWTEPLATDNCGGPLTYFSRTHEPGTAFAAGTTGVTYVFRDEAGNESAATFDIVVTDDAKPVVLTKNISRDLVNGEVVISADEVNDGSWDNCGIDISSVSPARFTCGNIGENMVTLTMVDVNGNEKTHSAVVTIIGNIPQPRISISRENSTFTGLSDNTIALGYGAQSLTLTVVDPNHSPATDYSWSPAAGLSNTMGVVTVFTPSAEGTYTFTVEAVNEYGCAATGAVTVHVIDARCGAKGEKVQVCRREGHASFDVCAASESVAAQLQNGGRLGSCHFSEVTPQEETIQPSVLTAYPNPFEQHMNLQFELPVADSHVRLDIYDVYGGKIMEIFQGAAESGQVHDFDVNTTELPRGVFLARLITSSGNTYSIKVICRR